MTRGCLAARAVWLGMNATVVTAILAAGLIMAQADDAIQARVRLVTRLMEAGQNREAEAVLEETQKRAAELPDGVARAELLNAWSSLHLKLGQLAVAEAELQRARAMVMTITEPGDIRPTVLHNLAAIEMRTGRYAEALSNEREALREWESSPSSDVAALIHGWASLGSLQYMMGDAQQARASMDRALVLAEAKYGSQHPLLADLLDSDAVVLDKLKLKKDARQARERARRIRGLMARADENRESWDIREADARQGRVYLLSK
jgi:tetratricopeptide (TPR) repeat protein